MGGAAVIALQAALPNVAFADDGSKGWIAASSKTVWSDSAGRHVEAPSVITSVAPSGLYAQSLLLAIAPDRLASYATDSNAELDLLGAGGGNLPVTGSLYSSNGRSFRTDVFSDELPDIILDVGEYRDSTIEDLNELQRTSGIPVVFIHCDQNRLPSAMRSLGKLLNCSDRAETLAQYAEDVLCYCQTKCEELSDSDRYTVLVAEREQGTACHTSGSLLGDAVGLAGAINVAATDKDTRLIEVNEERLLNWNPDIIVIADRKCYSTHLEDIPFSKISWKVSNAGYFGRIVPGEIEGAWIGELTPLSTNLLTPLYLGNTLYPDLFDYDLTELVAEYRALFFGSDAPENAAPQNSGSFNGLPSSAHSRRRSTAKGRMSLL